MTRQDFENLVEENGFDFAMEALYGNKDCITTYDALKDFAIHLLTKDNVGFALHLLDAIYNSSANSDWYYYDFTAGTTCTPTSLCNIVDVSTYIGFEKE